MPYTRNRRRVGNTNDPRYASTQERLHSGIQTIPEPTKDNLVDTSLALKEAVETLIGARGDIHNASVSFQDLQDMGVISVHASNGEVRSNIPFNDSTENSIGILKYCDGVTEDFGAGEGWYVKRSDGWYKLNEAPVAGAWDDLRFPATGNRLDSSSTRYTFDFVNVGISFASNARYTNEQLTYIIQMPHAWKEGTEIRPHLHWVQNQAASPNWLLAYRVYNNGAVPGTWTYTTSTPRLTYTGAGMIQISSFPDIILTGIDISGFIEVKLWRDTADTQGTLGIADPVGTSVLLKEFDVHYLADGLGSTQEYIK